MPKLRPLIATALLCGTASALQAQAADAVIGTWRLVRYQIWSQGALTEPLGRRPVGYVVFDATGHAFVQLTASADSAAPTAQASVFGAYFGTYSVRRTADSAVIAIRVEGSNDASYLRTTQYRPFRVVTDTLVLGVPGDYRATFIRVPRISPVRPN